MQRSGGTRTRALLARACAAALAAALAGCSGSGSSIAGNDAKAAGDTTSASAAPGKYQVLPEPCGSVGQSTLKAVLPLSDDYAGQATLTYDTDRRAGCTWSGTTDGSTLNLHIDIERSLSYEPAVSDESQAQQDYDKKLRAAGLSTSSASASSSASPSRSVPGSATPSATPSASASTSPSVSASPSASSSVALQPRVLGGLGNSAFLNDVLTVRGSGSHRDVTVVFRTANVLVTVLFSQWSTDSSTIPGSSALQDGAQRVASDVSGRFS